MKDNELLSDSPQDATNSLFPHTNPLPPPSFINILTDLKEKLRTIDPSSHTVQNLLHQLQEKMPYHPPLKIVSGPPLNWHIALLRIDQHLTSTFEDALKNLGFPLPPNEESFLRDLINHPCGWSATPPQHRNDSGFRYINKLFPQLNNSLEPILDDGTWPEDAPYIPRGLEAGPPMFILFISKTSPILQYYLLFDGILFHAGNTLEEVFAGMRDLRYTASSNQPDFVPWEAEDPWSDFGDIEAYFPHYVHHPGHGNWCLAWQVPEPPDKISTNGADIIKKIPVCQY